MRPMFEPTIHVQLYTLFPIYVYNALRKVLREPLTVSSYHCIVYVIVFTSPQQVLKPIFTWTIQLTLYITHPCHHIKEVKI